MAGQAEDVEASEVLQNLQNYQKDCVILDVREPGEYVQGHIPGAVNMPFGVLKKRISELAKEKRIMAICLSGGRAAQDSRILRSRGYEVAVM